jgi:hypothetical protein
VTDEPDIPSELGPEEPDLAGLLGAERPVRPAFRGALRRHLAARDPGYGPRPERLRLISAGYVGAGSLMIALGTLSATGVL